MGEIVPDAVERYLAELNHLSDPVARHRKEGNDNDLPIVDAQVGSLLRLLATAIGAKRILEIGTAIGYSGIWLAGALPPDGMLVTLGATRSGLGPRATISRAAALTEKVSVVIGDAQRMLAKVSGPFDLIFQDGDKPQYSLSWSAWSSCCGRAAC